LLFFTMSVFAFATKPVIDVSMVWQIPYWPYLTTQFSVAYDIYLEIIHCMQQCLQASLGWDAPNWRLLNACPVCFYKL
jgi:hypothetical protein